MWLYLLLSLLLLAPAAASPAEVDDDFEVLNLTMPRGEAERGRAAFVRLHCTSCHIVSGDESLPAPVFGPVERRRLGGPVTLKPILLGGTHMSAEQLVAGLNDQLSREVTTFLRYMLQAAAIKGAEHESVRQMYLDEVLDEVGHAQYLAHQIVLVGGTPRLAPDLTPPPSSVAEMLRADAQEEATDVKNYVELAALAEQSGLVALKIAMEEQAADEDRHGQEMRRLLG